MIQFPFITHSHSNGLKYLLVRKTAKATYRLAGRVVIGITGQSNLPINPITNFGQGFLAYSRLCA